MGIRVRAVSVAVLFFSALAFVRSGEDSDLRALIAKAIKAKGAEGNEAKYKGLTMKGAGTFYGLGEGIAYTGEWAMKGDKHVRHTLEIKVMDQTLTITQVVSGAKGWMKFNDEVKDMPADELDEEREEMYAKWVSSLAPLKNKAFKLAALGEVRIDDKPAVGVRVSHKGRRDVNLYIDAATFLVVKNEHQVKDVKGGANKEMSQETFFADFKEFTGTKYPTKVTVKRDGKLFVEATISDIRPVETVDDALFAKP
jgi:hypothetical protein